MGLFDYMSCELPFPALPESEEGGRKITTFPFKAGHQFQTKDLINALIEYKIGEDGVLYEKKVEYEKREFTEEEKKEQEGSFFHPLWHSEELSHEWVKENFTGYINFYDFIHDIDDGHDVWIEYQAHFKGGELQGEVELFKCNYECNKERKKNAAERYAEEEARQKYKKKWRYRFFGKYWNDLIYFIFGHIRKVGGWLGDSWKLESKLKF